MSKKWFKTWWLIVSVNLESVSEVYGRELSDAVLKDVFELNRNRWVKQASRKRRQMAWHLCRWLFPMSRWHSRMTAWNQQTTAITCFHHWVHQVSILQVSFVQVILELHIGERCKGEILIDTCILLIDCSVFLNILPAVSLEESLLLCVIH